MSAFALIGELAGGVGLFLLGMGLMTDGLKLAAGPALERTLARSTKTRLRGLASGALVTILVQSSSAVTVATIGFVNAGLLTLGQSLWVLFGANVGTTMTGWLVALVGLKFDIALLALPLIGLGMLLRLSGEGSRRGALGTAVAGFGVLFLGIDLLKDAFSGVADGFTLPRWDGPLGVLALVLVGVLMTVLMQASAAALVLAFTAAQGGMLGVDDAAAVVIGANVGTTVTAVIATVGATSNAKRAAAAHVLFNVLTAAVALLLLPWLLAALGMLRAALGLDSAPAAKLALFHTAFNLLGVALIWPLAGWLTGFLEARFRTAEEDEARPRHLDQTVLAVPALALDALGQEVRRMGGIALRMARAAAAGAGGDRASLARDERIVDRLNLAIADFIARLSRATLSQDSAARLPQILRVARYYETAADQAQEAAAAAAESEAGDFPAGHEDFQRQAEALFARCDPAAPPASPAEIDAALDGFEAHYQELKAELLEAGAQDRLTVADMDARLRAGSALRRAAQQIAKAARMLAGGAVPAHDPAPAMEKAERNVAH